MICSIFESNVSFSDDIDDTYRNCGFITDPYYFNQCIESANGASRARALTEILQAQNNERAKQKNERLMELRSKYRQPLKDLENSNKTPFCKIGYNHDQSNVIRQMSNYAQTNGLRLNDIIKKINSNEVAGSKQITDAHSKLRPNDTITFEILRQGKPYNVSMTCRDPNVEMTLRAKMLQQSLNGNWKGCIESSYELDNTWGLWSYYALVRSDCTIGSATESDQPPSAIVESLYEYRRRKILELAWSNEDLNTIKADVMKTITYLDNNNAGRYANDLNKLWEKYSSQQAEINNLPNNTNNPTVGTGTCFAVSPSGQVMTAQHVIEGASSINIKLFGDNEKFEAKVIQSSKSNDIALLQINKATPNWLSLKSTKKIKIGTPIFTMGYPVSSILGSEAKFTDGVVSSKSGIGNEATFFQITIPIQPGNSGGPVVTNDGDVVGIVTSTAAVKNFLNATGTLPQNVNWAVKSDYAMLLLDQPDKKNRINTRDKAIDHVNKSLCFIEAISK